MEAAYYDPYQLAAGQAAQVEPEQPEEEEEEEWEIDSRGQRKSNNLPFWGSQASMNLNPLILTNIQNSPYFKVNLFDLKTYHEVVDEIYYKVQHLEPWEKGSRKTSGQTGMCGGVRGVGAGGIVSSAFCLLYKLATLKLTRKQVMGLMNHSDSPYIRGLGFMYVRFTQPPADFLEWYEDYLDDEEVIDVKAGGGKEMTMGEMIQQFLTKLEWFDTRFPRIPVNVQKEITDYFEQRKKYMIDYEDTTAAADNNYQYNNADHSSRHTSRDRKSHDRESRVSKDRDRHGDRDRDRKRDHSHDRKRRRSRSRSRDRHHKKSSHKRRSRSRDRDHHRSRHGRDNDYHDELKKYSDHRKKEKKHKRSRSRSRDRDRRHH